MFRQTRLPDRSAAAAWNHTVIPDPFRRTLLNYAAEAMSESSIDPVLGGWSTGSSWKPAAIRWRWA